MARLSSIKTIISAFLALSLVMLSVCIQARSNVCAQEDGAEGWAVMIGITEYQYIDSTLSGADNAKALCDTLAPIWGRDHIKVLVNEEATKANIQAAICDWLEPLEDENDVVFLFFSGHGSYAYGHSICPYDTLPGSGASHIRDHELNSWLNNLESQAVIVILDSCLSGGFIPALSGNERAVMTSCDADETAFSVMVLGHSVFSYYLLQAIDEAINNLEIVDTNGDHDLSVQEVFDYVHPKVVAYADVCEEDQHPQLYSTSLTGFGLLCQATFDISPSVSSLTIDGITYSSSDLPISFTWMSRSMHHCEVTPAVPIEEGIQYTFTSWSDGNRSAARTISPQGGLYTANYTVQYQLTVESDYGDPSGEDWYNPGSTATVSVRSPSGIIVRKVFTNWSGDSTAMVSNATILMDEPKTVTANWRNDYLYLYVMIAGIIVVAGGTSAFAILKKRGIKAP